MKEKEIISIFEEKIEEIIRTKEAVASNLLMELKGQMKAMQEDLRKIDSKLEKAIMQINNEIEKHSIISNNELCSAKKRLSFVEKMVFGTAGTILLAVLSALIASVLV